MGSAAAVDHPHESTHAKSLSSSSSFRRRSHQSSTSTVMTESGDTSTTASVVTVSPPSTPATNNQLPSCDPSPTMSPWTRASSVSLRPQPTRSSSSIQIAGSAPSSSSIMMAQRANQSSMKLEDLLDPARHSEDDTASTQTAPTSSSTTTSVPVRSRTAVSTRSTRSGRYNSPPTSASVRAPLSSTTSAVDRRLIDKYERVNEEIERVIRATNADVLATGENGELLKQVRSELRKAKKNSTQIIQSQKELLEKMERQERGGLRRMFSMNREHKMEKLRNKLCEKLNQSVAADEQLDRLERQSVSLTRMSFGSLCGSNSGFGLPLEHDELYELERERDDIVANLISSAGLVDAQELHTRLALFSSEKRACECAMKQVDQCETLYRKALHLLRVALSTILAPTYSGSLKEFVLGPYPLAVEASQLVEQACRAIQPESRRRYSAYTPELSNVRPPKFPQQMVDFAKRGARSNFDPSNSAAIEAMRKLHLSENVVILLQRIVIAKLELIDKWKRDVERDLASAEEGYRKMETRLQAHVARLARSVSAA